MALRSVLLYLFGFTTSIVAANLNEFIAQQRAISLQSALTNVGPNGSMVDGAGAGIVVASPSKSDPNFVTHKEFWTWTGAVALTMKMIVDEFILGNEELQVYLEDYCRFQAVLQTTTNPSGSFLPSGHGLGEAKYTVNGARFNDAWGRPQRDGPALRAITLFTYSRRLAENGQEAKTKEVIWLIIANDLSYIGQYWNSTGFDLWEDVSGSSFFTVQNQYRSLIEGAALATSLGVKCTGCEVASDVLCFVHSFWSGEYYTASTNTQTQRSGKDANVMLGSISVFDITASCEDPSIQPCHSRSSADFKVWVDAFRNASLYPINQDIPQNKGIALGRYTEDIYFNGNPWYLITLEAAEFLYDVVAQWNAQGHIKVDSPSLPFLADLYPSAEEGIYEKYGSNSGDYGNFISSITAYADSFLTVVQQYTPGSGSMAEQFNKAPPHEPLSASDLTWSYAAFVTMAERRAGQYPPGWVPASSDVPAVCAASLTPGIYVPASAAGAPNVTVSCTVPVSFMVNATTYFGENLYIVGDTADFGSWNAENGQPMTASGYTAERPLWNADVKLTGGQNVSYVYVRKQNCNQGYIYETTNRTLSVPGCNSTEKLVVDDPWVGPQGSSGNC